LPWEGEPLDTVCVVKCGEYEQNAVQAAVDRSIAAIGGFGDVIGPGKTVALKVNLLKKNRPEDCVTTHPLVVAAVARRVRELGARAVIGDSPGGPFHKGALKEIYRISGMEEAARLSGAELNFDVSTVEVGNPQGVLAKQLTQTAFTHNADVVIDLPKLKTHGMTRYTGAVKNLFGTIPGTVKVEYHYRMPELERFSAMLVDVCQYVNPAFTIMDAVWGMEGDGPSAGDPRHIGAILASRSPYALDFAAAGLILSDPTAICTIRRAMERGIGPQRLGDINLVGDQYESFRISDYKVPESRGTDLLRRRAPGFVGRAANRLLTPRPKLIPNRCVGCGVCFRSCPPKAITMEDHRPRFDFTACIRCFCCHELCPEKAIEIKRSPLIRMLK